MMPKPTFDKIVLNTGLTVTSGGTATTLINNVRGARSVSFVMVGADANTFSAANNHDIIMVADGTSTTLSSGSGSEFGLTFNSSTIGTAGTTGLVISVYPTGGVAGARIGVDQLGLTLFATTTSLTGVKVTAYVWWD
jgi:hypothetical protein